MRRRRPAVAALTSLALVLAPLASNAQSSGVHLKDPCEANLLGALDIEDHIYTEGMIFPSVPQQLIGFATAPSRNTSSYTVMAIPLNEAQFKAVFRTEDVSGADAAQVTEASSFARRDGLVASDNVRGRSDFERLLKLTPNNFVILAGHNKVS